MSIQIRRTHPACHLGFATLLFFATCANAKAIYKCAEPGKTSYSDTACAGGELMPAMEQPAASDVAAAEIRAFRERAALDRLQGRLAAAAMPSFTPPYSRRQMSASAQECAMLTMKSRWNEEDVGSGRRGFGARTSEERRLRRLAQQVASHCAPRYSPYGQMLSASGMSPREFISAFPTTPRRAARQSPDTLPSGE
jgi:hypothetical protein